MAFWMSLQLLSLYKEATSGSMNKNGQFFAPRSVRCFSLAEARSRKNPHGMRKIVSTMLIPPWGRWLDSGIQPLSVLGCRLIRGRMMFFHLHTLASRLSRTSKSPDHQTQPFISLGCQSCCQTLWCGVRWPLFPDYNWMAEGQSSLFPCAAGYARSRDSPRSSCSFVGDFVPNFTRASHPSKRVMC